MFSATRFNDSSWFAENNRSFFRGLWGGETVLEATVCDLLMPNEAAESMMN